MDEKGIQLGGGRKTRKKKYFIRRDKRPKYQLRSENLEMVTVIECICQDGSAVKPSFIFSGKEFDGRWFLNGLGRKIGRQVLPYTSAVADIDHFLIFSVATSPNGWTDDFLCLEWFKDVFIPHAHDPLRNPTGAPVVLIFDGHGSHTSLDMSQIARQHNVILFKSPPHTTHYLQPLDVNYFGPIQQRWAQRCDALAQAGVIIGEKGMTRSNLIPEYLAIRDEVLANPATIPAAWRKTGLAPFNPLIFGNQTSSAFAPSHVSSTHARLPASYPSGSVPVSAARLTLPSIAEVQEEDEATDTEAETVSEDLDGTPLTGIPSLSQVNSLSTIIKPQQLSRASRTELLTAYQSLFNQHTEERTLLEEMHGHATLMAFENERLHSALNKPKDTGRIPLNVGARILTGEEGLLEAEQALAAREDAQRLAQEKKAADDARQQAILVERQLHGATRILVGPLSRKNKPELVEIAYSLSIAPGIESAEGVALREPGTVPQIKQRITDFLATHATLKEDRRYCGLYASERQTGKRASRDSGDSDEEVPAPTRPRLALGDLPVNSHSSRPPSANPTATAQLASSQIAPQYPGPPPAAPAVLGNGFSFIPPAASYPTFGFLPIDGPSEVPSFVFPNYSQRF